jgi:hypothetical protein
VLPIYLEPFFCYKRLDSSLREYFFRSAADSIVLACSFLLSLLDVGFKMTLFPPTLLCASASLLAVSLKSDWLVVKQSARWLGTETKSQYPASYDQNLTVSSTQDASSNCCFHMLFIMMAPILNKTSYGTLGVIVHSTRVDLTFYSKVMRQTFTG